MNLPCLKLWPDNLLIFIVRNLIVDSDRQYDDEWVHKFREKTEEEKKEISRKMVVHY